VSSIEAAFEDERAGPGDFSRVRGADEAGGVPLGPSSSSSSVSSSDVRSGVAAPDPDSSSCSSTFASSISIWSASDNCSGFGSGSAAFVVALRLEVRDAAAFRGLVSSLDAFTVEATRLGQLSACVYVHVRLTSVLVDLGPGKQPVLVPYLTLLLVEQYHELLQHLLFRLTLRLDEVIELCLKL
jgi:hypothetical protein